MFIFAVRPLAARSDYYQCTTTRIAEPESEAPRNPLWRWRHTPSTQDKRDDVMYSTDQRFQLRACRKFALEQNQRLFKQAHDLNQQAYQLLEQAQPDLETFERYHLLRNKAEEKFHEASEHLRLINQEFADNQSQAPAPLPFTHAQSRQRQQPRPILQHTGR